MIAGLPKWKYWSRLRSRSKPLNKRSKPLKQSSSKKKSSRKPSEMFKFLRQRIEVCSWICEECGEGCYTSSQTFQLAAQAHLLPKKKFKSIDKHPDSIVCLPAYGCGHHNTYDKSWSSARKMKAWPRFEKIIIEKLIPLLTSEEYKKLPSFLKEKYDERRNKNIV